MSPVSLSPESPAVRHGVGLFETILVVEGKPVHMRKHAERMMQSGVALGFPRPDANEFAKCVEEAAFRAGARGAVRCIYVAGTADLTDPAGWLLHASPHPIPAATLARRKHGRAVTLEQTWLRALPAHKTTSYASCALALRHAVACGADEALFMTPAGEILEGTATNVFAVRGSTLVTAPVESGVLPGVVRGWVLDEAQRLGFAVELRAPSSAEIREGAFFTGSLTRLAPIRTLDGSSCRSPGESFVALSRLYEREIGLLPGGSS